MCLDLKKKKKKKCTAITRDQHHPSVNIAILTSSQPSWRQRYHSGATHAILTACRPYGTVLQLHPRVDRPHHVHTDVTTKVMASTVPSWRYEHCSSVHSPILTSLAPAWPTDVRRCSITVVSSAVPCWRHQNHSAFLIITYWHRQNHHSAVGTILGHAVRISLV